MKKRIISLLMAVLMLGGMMSVSAFAADGDIVIEAKSWEDDGKYYADSDFAVAVKIIPNGYAGVQIDVQTNDKVVFNGHVMDHQIGYVERGDDGLLWVNGKTDDEGSIDVTDGLANINNDAFEDGVFVELLFSVAEDAVEGDVGEIEVTVKAASAEETWVIESATASTEVIISERPYMLGDLNSDGKVQVVDAAMAYSIVRGKTDPTETQNLAADVNGDGKVQVVDAAMIYSYVRGKLASFPAEN